MPINERATAFTFGTAGNDIISAQYLLGDMIDGLAGRDVIYGLDGNDTLLGGAGRDTIHGLGGDDLIDGGSDGDRLYGGAGNDVLRPDNGTIANDFIDGGDGIDTVDYGISGASRGIRIDLRITSAQDTRGAGRDTILNVENLIGTAFSDTVAGSDAGNVLAGGSGNDSIDGLGGHDQIDGGSGNDRLLGGAGNDMFRPDNGLIGNDVIDGGDGIDTVDYVHSGATQGVRVDLTITGAQDTGGAGVDTILNVEQVIGTNFSDTIAGSGGDNWINSSAGSDSLGGGDGNDLLFSGPADPGGDSLDGGNGDDRLRSGLGSDSLSGGSGADYLVGGLGSDTLSGGAGGDLFIFHGSSESSIAAPDVILDFDGANDLIVLQSAEFTGSIAFIGSDPFSASGNTEVRVTDNAGTQLVEVDFDGNGSADVDMAIAVVGTPLAADDFLYVSTFEF